MDRLPGVFLKEVRVRMHLGVRDIQRMSSKIAACEQNRRFYISPARLSQIESGEAVPSQFKIFTIATIYGLSFYELLARYGVDPDRAHSHRAKIELPATHPFSSEIRSLETLVTVPVRLDPSFKWEQTNLINRVVARWGEIPAALLLQFNPKQHMYAYVGMEDDTMSPLLRPGSVVMVDEAARRVAGGGWNNEYERPIYLIELRDGYVCSWCQVSGSELTIIPHPNSKALSRTFSLNNEAEVIGQVVGMTMRLVPPARAHAVYNVNTPEEFAAWAKSDAGTVALPSNRVNARL
jgi:transcriptional regulator with XRE-family HTH domain